MRVFEGGRDEVIGDGEPPNRLRKSDHGAGRLEATDELLQRCATQGLRGATEAEMRDPLLPVRARNRVRGDRKRCERIAIVR